MGDERFYSILQLNGHTLPLLASVLSFPSSGWPWKTPVSNETFNFFWELSACAGLTRTYKPETVTAAAGELLSRFHNERPLALSKLPDWVKAERVSFDAESALKNWETSLEQMIEIASQAEICKFTGSLVEERLREGWI